MRFISLILLSLLISMNASAYGIRLPIYYQQARETAPIHAQVSVDKVSPPQKDFGHCQVEATVQHVFRDKERGLNNTQNLFFPVSCYRNDRNLPAGGTLWIEYSGLKQAKYLEVFLEPTEKKKHYFIPGDQVIIIDNLTEEPYCQMGEPGFHCSGR